MRALRVPVDKSEIYIVGADVVFLKTWHHPSQMWFDFMLGAVFVPPPTPKDPPETSAKKHTNKTGYARLPNVCRQPYIYEKGVEQYVLPFEEFRRVSISQLKTLANADYPTWDKNAEGRPHRIPILNKNYNPPEWCLENLEGRFHVSPREVICQLEKDAIRVRLAFS